MLPIALKGLLARKLRTALTGFAVVLGVAFVAGTFVFTDTIDASFKDLFERTQKGVDVSVQAKKPVDDDFTLAPLLPSSTLERVAETEGVDAAAGQLEGQASLLDAKGEPIVSNAGPTMLFSTVEERFEPLDYGEGDPPDTANEVAIDKATADDQGWEVGDRITVAARTPAKPYTIAGIATLGDVENIGGSSFLTMTLDEVRRVTQQDGFSSVVAAAEAGTTPEQVKANVQRTLAGRPVEVRTGKEQAEEQAQEIGEALGFIRTALLVFAGVALLVGGFLIFNTFTVTVAQRTREFALLRTLGASRGQILRSVLAETVVIGLLASALGVAAGLALAPALSAMLAAFGLDLPNTGTVIEPRTIIVGFIVGTIATVVSGMVPARRATRVEPVEAMRDSVTPGAGRIRRRRVVLAAGLTVAGLALLVTGLFGDVGSASATASLMGLGALVVVFGVALLAPVLVRPLASAIGRPIERVQGLTGRLARENAVRQPQRTAVTASALMIGLALVVFVTIFAAGARASFDKVIDEQVSASLLVLNKDGYSPMPSDVADRLREVDGVQAVSALRFETGKVRGVKGTVPATGVDANLPKVLRLDWERGSDALISGLAGSRALIDTTWADSHDLGVGDTIHVTTPAGKQVDYAIAGSFDSNDFLTGNLVVSTTAMVRDWNSRDIAVAMAAGAPGVDAAELRRRAAVALKGFPSADPMTVGEYKDEIGAQVNQLLGLVFALLSLSVIVALLGIVNTLALSVHERTRELGMLRAVGMSRRQVRRMVRSEAVITAGIGAVLGLVLGIAFAALISRPLADEGFQFALPVVTLLVVAVLAALAGVVAAIPPARRAARVDVLRAVTME